MSWLAELGELLAEERQNRAAGTVVVLDFLLPAELSGLREPLASSLGPQWGVHLVADPTRTPNCISADKAVDLREDLSLRSFFLVIREEAGAGLQGVYDVADVLMEQSILRSLRTRLRQRLRAQDRKLDEAAWKACQESRRVWGAGSLDKHIRREITYLDSVVTTPSFQEAGRQMPLLGLIPDTELRPEALAANAQAVSDLIRSDRTAYTSCSERVARLKLTDSTLERGVSQVLEQVNSIYSLEEWLSSLAERGLTFNRWIRQTDLAELEKIELHPLVQGNDKPYKWTGLDLISPHGLFFSLNPESQADTLEVRWKAVPQELPKGAVEYRIQLLPVVGEEPLLEDYVSHRPIKGGTQKWQASRERLADLGQEYSARVSVSAVGKEETRVETVEFQLTASLVPEVRLSESASSSVRSMWDLILEHVRSEGEMKAPRFHVRGNVLEVAVGRLRRKLVVPPYLAELEKRILANGTHPGMFRTTLRQDGSLEAPKSDEIEGIGGKAWDHFFKSRERLFRKIRRAFEVKIEEDTANIPCLLEAYDLTDCADEAWDYARAYQQLLDGLTANCSSISATENGRKELEAALRVDSLQVADLSGKLLCRVVSPTHPLRLLWLLGYGSLLQHWSDRLVKYKGRERISGAPAPDIDRLTPHLFPAFSACQKGELWAYADGIGLYWGILTPVDSGDSQQAVADLFHALKLKSDRSVVADLSADLVTRRINEFLDARPYVETLQVNALASGDASFLGRVMIEVRRQQDPGQSLYPRLDLRLCPGDPEAQPGRYLDQLALARRKNQPLSDSEAALFRSTGNSNSPGLQWAHILNPSELPPCHLCLLLDSFQAKVATAPANGISGGPEVYGLSLPMLLHFEDSSTGDMKWLRWVEPTAGETQQRHPVKSSYTDWLVAVHRSILRAAHVLAVPDNFGEDQLPGAALVLDSFQQKRLEDLHNSSDWVITLDRYLGPEYFDQPDSSSQNNFSRFLLDYVPGLLDGTSHRLLLSTSRTEEILEFLRQGLKNLGVESGETSLQALLFHLKAISGRATLRLGGRHSLVPSALALATFHHHLQQDGSLKEAVVLPVESVLALDDESDPLHTLVLRVELSRQRRREILDFEVSSVELASDSIQAFSEPLRAQLLARADSALSRIQAEFGLHPAALDTEDGTKMPIASCGPVTMPIRRRRLVRVLRAYLEKSVRYGTLSQEAFATLLKRVEQLLDPGFDRIGSVRATAVLIAPCLARDNAQTTDYGRGKFLLLGGQNWPELFLAGSDLRGRLTNVDNQDGGSTELSQNESVVAQLSKEVANSNPNRTEPVKENLSEKGPPVATEELVATL